MTMTEILEAVRLAKKIVPIAHSTFEALGPVVETEKKDVKAALADVVKSFTDLKGNIAVLEAAAKAGLNS